MTFCWFSRYPRLLKKILQVLFRICYLTATDIVMIINNHMGSTIFLSIFFTATLYNNFWTIISFLTYIPRRNYILLPYICLRELIDKDALVHIPRYYRYSQHGNKCTTILELVLLRSLSLSLFILRSILLDILNKTHKWGTCPNLLPAILTLRSCYRSRSANN